MTDTSKEAVENLVRDLIYKGTIDRSSDTREDENFKGKALAAAALIADLQAQLATAQENALREALVRCKEVGGIDAYGSGTEYAKGYEAAVNLCHEEILALLNADRPAPAPTPDAVVKAALEWAASLARDTHKKNQDQVASRAYPSIIDADAIADDILWHAKNDPATLDQIIAKAGGRKDG
jgi:hypothetical protein